MRQGEDSAVGEGCETRGGHEAGGDLEAEVG